MKKIKWGIIGLGNIAQKFAEAINKMDDCELFAVASRTKEKSEVFGNKFNLSNEKCFGTYEEFIKDSDVDAIYIALPNSLHKEFSILCLNNKKAVLCEKPVTLNTKETIEVIECAKRNNTFFMEAMKTRFLPVHKKVKEILESRILGEPKLLQADFGFYSEFDKNSRLYDPNGGGALYDVGIYPVSYSSYIFGNFPKKIYSNFYLGKSSVDENISINLSYENGTEAQLYASINLATKREANIICTNGFITIPKFSNGEKLIISENNKIQEINMPFSINGFEYEIKEVNDCLRANQIESKIMSWNDSIEIMRIMDELKK